MGNDTSSRAITVEVTGPETSVRPNRSVRRFLTHVLPQVNRELRRWNRCLDQCHDWALFKQAMSSLSRKRFHSQGGSFYALYNPPHSKKMVTLIVAMQTISDYLDNLCDRGGVYDEAAFRHLHHAMLDTLSLRRPQNRNYYRFYPANNDGGYLHTLVEECAGIFASLPSGNAVRQEALRLVSLYNDLQVYKHLAPHLRSCRLKRWFREKGIVSFPPLYWWEFAAACGSTLAVFALLGAATVPGTSEEDVRMIVKAYFPWVCGLHILLDYWIDQEEDRREGDFNFAACYKTGALAARRLQLFLHKSLEGVSRLPHPDFHRTIVNGLLAVYLSDPKVKKQGFQDAAAALLDTAGREAKLYHRLCVVLRKFGIL